MVDKREGRNKGGYAWADVSHFHAGGGKKKKSDVAKLQAGLKEREVPKEGEYCLIVKPLPDIGIGTTRKIVNTAYYGQVTHLYPEIMEVRVFKNGKSVRGRNGLERIPIADVKKSEELMLYNVDTIPQEDIENGTYIDAEEVKKLILPYMSLYPLKQKVSDDIFKVEKGEFVLVNKKDEETFLEERYIGEVVYTHPNMIKVKEYRHGCSVAGTVRSIIRDELLRGIVKVFGLKMKPEKVFTKEELKHENFKKEHKDLLK